LQPLYRRICWLNFVDTRPVIHVIHGKLIKADHGPLMILGLDMDSLGRCPDFLGKDVHCWELFRVCLLQLVTNGGSGQPGEAPIERQVAFADQQWSFSRASTRKTVREPK